MVTSVTKGGTQKLPNEFQIDMTIIWKAFEGALFDGSIQLVFDSTILGENTFSVSWLISPLKLSHF
jgi:hypothetical protein